MTPQKLKQQLFNEGYGCIREVHGRGLCGIMPFLYTYAIVFGLDESGYQGRWCYATAAEAVEALMVWDGIGDPAGNWIKYKGLGREYSNKKHPDYKNFESWEP